MNPGTEAIRPLSGVTLPKTNQIDAAPFGGCAIEMVPLAVLKKLYLLGDSTTDMPTWRIVKRELFRRGSDLLDSPEAAAAERSMQDMAASLLSRDERPHYVGCVDCGSVEL